MKNLILVTLLISLSLVLTSCKEDSPFKDKKFQGAITVSSMPNSSTIDEEGQAAMELVRVTNILLGEALLPDNPCGEIDNPAACEENSLCQVLSNCSGDICNSFTCISLQDSNTSPASDDLLGSDDHSLVAGNFDDDIVDYSKKVVICHHNSSEEGSGMDDSIMLDMDDDAVKEHQDKHGDTLGPCTATE